MIDDREDYDFVTIPEDIRIDGGILPVRDVAGEGVKVLRGEDPAFLLEALAERTNAIYPGHPYVFFPDPDISGKYEMTPEIRADRMQSVARGVQGLMYSYAKDPPSTFGAKWDLQQTDTGIISLYGLQFAAADVASDVYEFLSGSPLKLDPLRALFYDVKRLRSFQHVNQTTINTTAESIVGEGAWQGVTRRSLVGTSDIYRYVRADYTGTLVPEFSYSIRQRATSGTYTASVNPQVAPYVGSVQVFGLFTFIVDMGAASHICMLPLESSFVNATATVSAAALSAAADNVMQHYNFHEYAIGSGHDDCFSGDMSVNLYMLCTLGDHTDIADVAWNWKPTQENENDQAK